ncbi:serine hydrolase-like protein isoform X2 [Anabrus simplex]|uniref:serine hydrolase-like protein isoform X2 n=1 Tax=Anabrus simplex TaxID=316456 RepID=UPI0034DCEC25
MAELKSDVRNIVGTTTITELKIPVPWGHIAAKTWGDSSCFPILCLHGEVDNAATFDRLIPLLPQQFYYMSIDLPGHGHSSHYLPGIPYKFIDYVAVLRRIVDHFSWAKINILGHDLGGLLGLFFAAVYPDKIMKLIVFDVIHPVLPRQHLINHIKLNNEHLLSIETDEAVPQVFSYQTLYEKLCSWRAKDSSVAAIDASISRNAEQVADGSYLLTMDQRVRYINYPFFDDRQFHIILKNLRCELLIFTAKGIARNQNILPVTSLLYIFRYKCARFEHHIIEGNCDIHLNFPTRLVPIMASFLQEIRSSL